MANLPYAIVVEATLEELVNVVNQAVESGYIPLGGISVVKNSYAQAIYNPTITPNNERADTNS